MSVWGLGNAIRSRIIVELLSPGEYTGIWLFARANTGIWLFAPANILESGQIHWGYKKMIFSVKNEHLEIGKCY